MKILSTFTMALMIALAQTTTANTFKTEKWLTHNGVHVVFYPAREVPMLDISLSFAAGAAYDGNQYGLSTLTSHLMNQGNAGKDANTLAEALANTGAQYSEENNRDMVVYNLRTLTDKEALESSVTVFAQMINHPDFPDEAFEREKKQQLMAVEQSQESPEDVADINFFKALYKQHPYAHPVNGTSKTLNALSKQQIIEFYQHYYVGANATLAIVGDVDSQTAHQLAEQLTHELPKGQPAPPITQAPQLTQEEKINIPFPSSQTMIRLGQIGIDHHNPDYFPLMVGNYILGGGSLVSQLAVEVREKRGLTYGVASQFVPMSGKGPFIINLSTRNQQANQAIAMVRTILDNFVKNGPDDQEIKAAKQYLTGSFPLSLASNRSIATLLLRMTFYHLPEDYLDKYTAHINAVTQEQIKEAFKKQVDPHKLLLVTVGQS